MDRVYIQAVFLLLLVSSCLIKTSYSVSCKRDHLLTGTNTDVAWWLIIKLPQFNDLYLYFDPLTDQFIEGKFLRATQSAFGQALKLMESDDVQNYVAFNDHWTTITTNDGRSDTGSRAHEKGIIAWGENNGFWIQHTLPKFPYQRDNNYIMNTFNTIDFTNYPTNTNDFLRFSQKGLDPNLFPPNIQQTLTLSQQFLQNIKNKIGNGPRPDHARMGSIKSDFQYAQHILCVSIDTKPKVQDFINYMNNIMFGVQFYRKNGEVLGFGTQPIQPSTAADPIYNTMSNTINGVTLNAKLMIYPAITGKIADIHRTDTWSSIFRETCVNQPCIERSRMTDSNIKMQVSTYKKSINGQNSSPDYIQWPGFNYIFGGNKEELKWGMQPFKLEHGKLGFLPNGAPTPSDNSWNVCFSGGNVATFDKAYKDGYFPSLASVMICFNSEPLRNALNQLRTNDQTTTTTTTTTTPFAQNELTQFIDDFKYDYFRTLFYKPKSTLDMYISGNIPKSYYGQVKTNVEREIITFASNSAKTFNWMFQLQPQLFALGVNIKTGNHKPLTLSSKPPPKSTATSSTNTLTWNNNNNNNNYPTTTTTTTTNDGNDRPLKRITLECDKKSDQVITDLPPQMVTVTDDTPKSVITKLCKDEEIEFDFDD